MFDHLLLLQVLERSSEDSTKIINFIVAAVAMFLILAGWMNAFRLVQQTRENTGLLLKAKVGTYIFLVTNFFFLMILFSGRIELVGFWIHLKWSYPIIYFITLAMTIFALWPKANKQKKKTI